MKTVSVGVVGCGYWGPNFVRNFSQFADTEVKAVCDLSEDRLRHIAKIYPECLGFTDLGAMLRRTDLDAVIIATPVASHFPLAMAALSAGKHTLIEKPMALSGRECEELIETARLNGAVLMVGHTYLYSDAVRMITDTIRNGEIGEIRYINCQRLNLGLFQNDINVAWDLAPHDISIILHILGEFPETINCQGNAHINPSVEDVTNISLTFASKRFATIQSSWLEPRKIRQMTFVGTRKMIVYDDLQPLEKIRIHDVRVEQPPHYDDFSEFHYSYHYGDCHIPHIEQKEPLSRMCRHFVDCIRGGERPLSGGEEGLALVRILETCTASLRAKGGPVAFSHPPAHWS